MSPYESEAGTRRIGRLLSVSAVRKQKTASTSPSGGLPSKQGLNIPAKQGLNIPADVTDLPAYVQQMVADGKAQLKQYEDGLVQLAEAEKAIADTTKAIEEKVAVAKSRLCNPDKTKICCTRYGNVMCSRGSVIPLWIEQIRAGLPITLTEPSMTRFIMSLDEAVDLVLFAFEHGANGDILVQKAPACTVQIQAEAVCELFGGKKEDIKVIGIRHGEKMYETLLTKEECAKAVDMGNFYRVPADNRDLNYDKFFTEGDVKNVTIEEFNSDNAYRLSLEETKVKIAALEYIQEELAKKK